MPKDWESVSVILTNETGLHARPAVRLTQIAKSFPGRVEIALSATGPWVDAKSPVKLMRVRAPAGAQLHVRAAGKDASAILEQIVNLAARRYDEDRLDESNG